MNRQNGNKPQIDTIIYDQLAEINNKIAIDQGVIDKLNLLNESPDNKLTTLVNEMEKMNNDYSTMLNTYVSSLSKIKENVIKKEDESKLLNVKIVDMMKSNLSSLAKQINTNKKLLLLGLNDDLVFDDVPPYAKFAEKLKELERVYFDPNSSAKQSAINFCSAIYKIQSSIEKGTKYIEEEMDKYIEYLDKNVGPLPRPIYSGWEDVVENLVINAKETLKYINYATNSNKSNYILQADLKGVKEHLSNSIVHVVKLEPPHFECISIFFAKFIPFAKTQKTKKLMLDFIIDAHNKVNGWGRAIYLFYSEILTFFAEYYPYVYLCSLPVLPAKMTYKLNDKMKEVPGANVRFSKIPPVLLIEGNEDIEWVRYNYLQGKKLELPRNLMPLEYSI